MNRPYRKISNSSEGRYLTSAERWNEVLLLDDKFCAHINTASPSSHPAFLVPALLHHEQSPRPCEDDMAVEEGPARCDYR